MSRTTGVSGWLAAALLVIVTAVPSYSLNNGLARTPPMGWNTFNQFGGAWNEAILREIGDSLIATGLAQCGYIYVNADGHNAGQNAWPGQGWPALSQYGLSAGWPKKVADYLHPKGLKFGVYMTTTTNIQATMNDLIAGDVDFLKHDDWGGKPTAFWGQVRDAILATGRPIVYSTNNIRDPAYCNMARTGNDITAKWEAIMTDFDQNYSYLSTAQPGYWPDADMLEVGCNAFVDGRLQHILTPEEDRAHFSMWCMMATPLIVGYNFARKSQMYYVFSPDTATFPMQNHINTVRILSNTEVIALNQDSLGKAGRRIKGQGAGEVWIKDLKDGTKGLAFFNRTSAPLTMSVSAGELGWGTSSQIYIRDLWAHETLTPFSGTFSRTVAVHAAEVFRVSTQPVQVSPETMRKMERSRDWLRTHGVDLFPEKLIPSVLAGRRTDMRMFDLRGRAIAAINPATVAAGAFVMRIDGPQTAVGQRVWLKGTR